MSPCILVRGEIVVECSDVDVGEVELDLVNKVVNPCWVRGCWAYDGVGDDFGVWLQGLVECALGLCALLCVAVGLLFESASDLFSLGGGWLEIYVVYLHIPRCW